MKLLRDLVKLCIMISRKNIIYVLTGTNVHSLSLLQYIFHEHANYLQVVHNLNGS